MTNSIKTKNSVNSSKIEIATSFIGIKMSRRWTLMRAKAASPYPAKKSKQVRVASIVAVPSRIPCLSMTILEAN